MSIFLTIISLLIFVSCYYGETKSLDGNKKQDNKQVATVFDPIEGRYVNVTVKKEKSDKSGSAIIFGDMSDLISGDDSLSEEDRHALANFGNLIDETGPKKPGFGDVKRIYGYGESAGVSAGAVDDSLMGLAV